MPKCDWGFKKKKTMETEPLPTMTSRGFTLITFLALENWSLELLVQALEKPETRLLHSAQIFMVSSDPTTFSYHHLYHHVLPN